VWWVKIILYLLYLLAVLWTGALSEGKLSLNEHVCILKIGFCAMSEKLFLLYLLAVLWTGALSDGKLPLNEHIMHAGIFKIGFCVMSENLFLLYLLYLLAVLWTGALSGGKLPLNEHVCIRKIRLWVMSEICSFFTSFTHLPCCELVHSQRVCCLWMNMLAYSR